jgi:hypothetical protein
MSEGIAKLKEIGAQRIYETTHISRANIDAIFTQNYVNMTKVQLFGFLTILEREYKIDLTEIRDDYLSKHTQRAKESTTAPSGATTPKAEPFTISESSPSSNNSTKGMLLIAALVIVGVIGFFMMQPKTTAVSASDNSTLTQEIPIATQSVETNITEQAVVDIPEVPEKPLVPETFIIEPKAKLWMGFIDLKTLKRSQKMTSKSVEIDPSKGWLILFGHGYVTVRVGDETFDFSEPDKLRLVYEEGQLKQITTEEFKARNRGDNW